MLFKQNWLSQTWHVDLLLSPGAANRESLDVSFGHISKFSAGISMYLCDAPKETFDIVDKTTTEVAKEMCPDLFEHMGDIHVRLSGLPLVEQIRDIR